MVSKPVSSQRVITQNLLVSASEAERRDVVSPQTLSDLSALINMAVLYDELFVLDRALHFAHIGPPSELVSFLADKEIVRSMPIKEKDRTSISKTAKKHLIAFLGDD